MNLPVLPQVDAAVVRRVELDGLGVLEIDGLRCALADYSKRTPIHSSTRQSDRAIWKTTVQGPRIARSLAEPQASLTEPISLLRFAIEQIECFQQATCGLRKGAPCHRSRGCFQITGFVQRRTGHEGLGMYQPRVALTGRVMHRCGDPLYQRPRARFEPGKTGLVTHAPTVQTKPANQLVLYGGRATTRLDLFFYCAPRSTPVARSSHLDLGRHASPPTAIHDVQITARGAVVRTFARSREATGFAIRLRTSNRASIAPRSIRPVLFENQVSGSFAHWNATGRDASSRVASSGPRPAA